MASGGGSQKNEGSKDSISKPGPSPEPRADKNDITWFMESCPPIMVHTRSTHRSSEGHENPENLLEKDSESSSKRPSTRDETKNCSGESNRHEGELNRNHQSNRHEGEANRNHQLNRHEGEANRNHQSDRHGGEGNRNHKSKRHRGEANRKDRLNRHRGERNRSHQSNRRRGERNRSHQSNRRRGESNRNDASNNHEEEEPLIWGFMRNVAQQTDEIGSHFKNRTFAENFRFCYNENVHDIRTSWVIFVFQFFVGSLAASAIIMGILFFRSCVGDYAATVPAFTISMGISGALVLCHWVSQACRERRGERYWNRGKNRLAVCFIALLIFMVLELIFLSNVSSSNLQVENEIKCNKIYVTYMYCLYIVNPVFLVLAALLYLPDCVSYISTFKFLETSNADGDYQPL